MAKTEPAAAPQSGRDRRGPPARTGTGDPPSAQRPLPHHDPFAGGGARPELGAALIAPVAAAVVIAWTVSPAITFVLLRSKGYGLIAAGLGVAAGGLGLLLAIAAPSHRPAG